MQNSRTHPLGRTAPALAATALGLLALGPRPAAAQAGPDSSIHRYSSTGADLGVFADLGNNAPAGLAVNSAGNVFASQSQTGAILEYTPSGQSLGEFAGTSGQPSSLAFNSAGDLFVTDEQYVQTGGGITTSTTIAEFSPTGQSLGTFAPVSGDPDGLAVNAAGDVFIASDISLGGGATRSFIQEYSPSGTLLRTLSSPNLTIPRGLAFDAAGNLYAANASTVNGQDDIEEFSPTGMDLGVFNQNRQHILSDIAFDTAGNLLETTAFQGNQIFKVSPTGADLGTFAPLGSQIFAFSLAVSPTGDVLVGEYVPASNPVPEASTTASFGLLLALGGMAVAARRRKAA